MKRNIFFLGLVSLFNDFSNEMIQSVMPVFLTVTLGVPPLGVGLIEGIADAVASFLKIFSGWLSDRLRRRKLPAVMGYVLSVSTRPLFAIVTHVSHALLLRVVDRVGKGFREAPRDALIAESAGRRSLARSFGLHRAMDAAGGMLGPLAAFILLPIFQFNYRPLFLVAFGIGTLAIVSFVFVREPRRAPAPPSLPPRLKWALFREHRSFALFIAAVFLFGLGALPITLLLVKPIEAGVSLGAVPLFYFIYSLLFVASALPLGRLADRLGERVVISIGFSAAIAGYLALAFSDSLVAVVAAFALFGVAAGATDGVERALAAVLIGDELLATGEGLLNGAVGISSLLAGVIGGVLWMEFGASAAFFYAAGVSALGLILFAIIGFRRIMKGLRTIGRAA
ncbi:MAG: MFS transporter [Candidatus Colwellbacteria bacterium]|nr:MFS transporter [Candidatus Colwellbacteria bacterium]